MKKSVIRGTAYYAIAESHRDENGRTKTIYFRRLGKLTEPEAKRWRFILSGDSRGVLGEFIDLQADTVCFNSWNHGISCLVSVLWEKLGFSSIISESLSHVPNKSFVAKFIEAMIVNRLEDPRSKLGLVEWLEKDTSLQFLIDLPPLGAELNEMQFYRAMDELLKRRDTIEKKIYERIVKPRSGCSVLAKDLTSTYFEGKKSPLAKYGYSRDHRPDRMQVNWSLIETEEGLPITLEVYEGNVVDKKTVIKSIRRIKRVFGITRGIFIVDRGMSTEDNIKAVVEEGFQYVAAEKLDQKAVLSVVDEALSKGLEVLFVEEENGKQLKLPVGAETQTPAEASVILRGREILAADGAENNGGRYIVLHSPQKEKEDLKSLKKDLCLGKQILSKVEKYAINHPNKVGNDPLKVLKMAVRHLEAEKLSKYFVRSWDPVQKKLAYELKQKKIESDTKYAGLWVLRTNVPSEEKKALDIIELYKGLWKIEHTFREIKSSLEIRPMYHRKGDRVKAHIWICVIAYLIEKIIEEELRKKEIFAAVAEPITGMGSIQSFRNITLSELGLKGSSTRARWWVTTELDKAQLKILKALGIDKNEFKLSRGLSY